MFNLNEILQNAQNGKAIDNLAQQFGIAPYRAQAAVHALIPAISAGLMQKAAQPSALGGIISALADADYQAAFSNATAAQSENTIRKGKDVVADMFGPSHIVHQIAQQASAVTGLRPDLLDQMLPVVVSIALGGMAKSAQSQGIGLRQLASAAEQGRLGAAVGPSGGGIFGMLANFFGSLFGAPQAGAPSEAQGALDKLTAMFQPGTLPPEVSRSGLQEQIGKILRSGKP